MVRGPSQCARELKELFSAQYECAERLLAVLDDEREALSIGETDRLDEVTANKNRLLRQLEVLDQRQTHLLQSLPTGPTTRGLGQALHWCDEDGSVTQAYEEMAECVIRCQRANQRNGLLVQHRLGYVRRALNVLRQGHGDALVYGPDGRTGPVEGSRLLAET